MVDNSIKSITLKEYEKIPILYDNEGTINKQFNLDVGDYYIMREPEDCVDVGDIVSVYEVIRLTDTGNESKVTVLRVE